MAVIDTTPADGATALNRPVIRTTQVAALADVPTSSQTNIANSPTADFFGGASAVLGAQCVPPIIVTPTTGTGRFNRGLNVIEVDPKVLTWPTECQRFLGAHEAAHAQQKPLADSWVLNLLVLVVTAYVVVTTMGAVRFGFGNQMLELFVEATLCTGLVFLVMIETFLFQCRRREYEADRAAAAAVGTAGIIEWRDIAEQELSRPTRTMLALNAVTGLRTHPTWSRRIAAVQTAASNS